MDTLKSILISLIIPLVFGSQVSVESPEMCHFEPICVERPIVRISIENATTGIFIAQSDPSSTIDSIFCSCVLTVNSLVSNLPLIDAKDFEPNIANSGARVGDLVLESYPDIEHIALITDVNAEGFIVSEGNYRKCTYSESRVVPYNSERIRGFFRL